MGNFKYVACKLRAFFAEYFHFFANFSPPEDLISAFALQKIYTICNLLHYQFDSRLEKKI